MERSIKKIVGVAALCVGVVTAVFISKTIRQCSSCRGYYNGRTKGRCPHCGRIDFENINER